MARLDVVAKVKQLTLIKKGNNRLKLYRILFSLYLVKYFAQHLFFVNPEIVIIFRVLSPTFFCMKKLLVVFG